MKLYKDALSILKKAVIMANQKYGPRSEPAGQIHCDIRTIFIDTLELDEALISLQLARDIYDELKIVLSPAYANLLCRTADALILSDRPTEAIPLAERGLALCRRLYPADHHNVVSALTLVRNAHSHAGNFAAAKMADANASALARHSQVQCTAEGCTRKMKTDGTPGRWLHAVPLLLQGVPDSRLEGAPQGGVQEASIDDDC